MSETMQMPTRYHRRRHPQNWLRVRQVAALLNRSPRTIQRMATEGTLKSERIGSLVFIDPASVSAFLADNGLAGTFQEPEAEP